MAQNKNSYITPEQMRKAEATAAAKGLTIGDLMEAAGRGVANAIEVNFGSLMGRGIVVLAGKGNNGGDGLAAARYLGERGAKVVVILLGNPAGIKTQEARRNWSLFTGTKIVADSIEELQKHEGLIKNASIVIDAIIGTGIQGELREPDATAIQLINASKGIKVAIDIPTGIDPGTGDTKVPTVRADLTITLHRAKIGLKGKDEYTGRLVVVPIGLD